MQRTTLVLIPMRTAVCQWDFYRNYMNFIN